MSSQDNRSHGTLNDQVEFSPCTIDDFSALIAPSMKLLTEIQDEKAIDLSILSKIMVAQFEQELPDYTQLQFNGILAGWYHLIQHDHALELDDVNVIDEYRRLGLGTLMIKRVQAFARELTLPIICQVVSLNTQALCFYKTSGFLEIQASGKHRTLQWTPWEST